MLAAAILQAQKIEVEGVTFTSPFFGWERARQSAAYLKLPLRVLDFTDKFLPLIYRPPHGFGRGHNPCIDCHILMLREAGEVMLREGFDFLFTGEVLGQRPMSQNRGTLNLVARESGFPDLVLRPLSARLLKPTRPELESWVDRERLLALSGRGRKRQMALARELGLGEYPSPAGGCLLTDPGYASRLKELLSHRAQVSRQDLELLRWGRHFRLPAGAKAVVGRTQQENEALLALKTPADFLLKVEDYPGPLVLVAAGAPVPALTEAAGLAGAYSDAPTGVAVTVAATRGTRIQLIPLTTSPKERFKGWLVGGGPGR